MGLKNEVHKGDHSLNVVWMFIPQLHLHNGPPTNHHTLKKSSQNFPSFNLSRFMVNTALQCSFLLHAYHRPHSKFFASRHLPQRLLPSGNPYFPYHESSFVATPTDTNSKPHASTPSHTSLRHCASHTFYGLIDYAKQISRLWRGCVSHFVAFGGLRAVARALMVPLPVC